jgi:hypothetical protein
MVPGTGLVTERTEGLMPIVPLTRRRHQPTASAVLPTAVRLPALRQPTFVLLETQALFQAMVPGTGLVTERTEGLMPIVPLTRRNRRIIIRQLMPVRTKR